MNSKVLIAVLTVVFGVSNAVAQEQSYSLEEAVTFALAKDLRLKSAQQEIESASAEQALVRSMYRPKFDWVTDIRRRDEPATFTQPAIQVALPGPVPIPVVIPESEIRLFDRDIAMHELSFVQVLWLGGQRKALTQQAELGTQVARAQQDAERHAVILDVRRAYLGRWHAERVLAVATDSYERLATLADLTRALMEGGSMSVSNLDVLRITLAQQKIQGIQSEISAQREEAANGLLFLTGIEAHDSLKEPRLPQLPATSLEQATAVLEQQNPTLRQLGLALEVSAAKVDAAKRSRFPAITLTGAYRHIHSSFDAGLTNSRNAEGWHIGLTIQQPLFSGGATSARIDREAAKARAQSAQRAHAAAGLRTQISTTLESIQEARKRFALTESAQSTARKWLALTKQSSKGDGESIEKIVEATIFLAFAEFDLLRAEYDLHRHTYSLAHLLGSEP